MDLFSLIVPILMLGQGVEDKRLVLENEQYINAYSRAIDEFKPMIVFIKVPMRQIKGAVTASRTKMKDVKGPAIIIALPFSKNDNEVSLWWIETLPGDSDDIDIHKTIWRAKEDWRARDEERFRIIGGGFKNRRWVAVRDNEQVIVAERQIEPERPIVPEQRELKAANEANQRLLEAIERDQAQLTKLYWQLVIPIYLTACMVFAFALIHMVQYYRCRRKFAEIVADQWSKATPPDQGIKVS